MGDEKQSLAALTNRARQQPHHASSALVIKIPCRLVSEDKSRIIGQCSGNSYPLLFAPAELGGIVITSIGEADKIKKIAGTVMVRAPQGNHRQQHVLQRAQLRDQIIGLKDDAYLLGTVF